MSSSDLGRFWVGMLVVTLLGVMGTGFYLLIQQSAPVLPNPGVNADRLESQQIGKITLYGPGTDFRKATHPNGRKDQIGLKQFLILNRSIDH